MPNLYRIKPLEKKSIEFIVEVFEKKTDGTVRGFAVTEYWRWGQAFRPEHNPVHVDEIDYIECDPNIGWGCELDDLVARGVEFDGDFSSEECSAIESILDGETQDDQERSGMNWLQEGDHNWQIRSEIVAIVGPVQIDLVDEDGYGDSAVIEANVAPLTD